jgi:hypothetical protein
MKLRTGRHNHQIVYIQLGDEPSDDDQMLAVFMDVGWAVSAVEIVNGEAPPLDTT